MTIEEIKHDKMPSREIEKGVWVIVEVCPQCRDEWIDKKIKDFLIARKV